MKMVTALMIMFALGAVSQQASAAKLYKWVDKRGNVSYQDSPPPPEFGGTVEERTVNEKGSGRGSDDPALAEAIAKNPVLLYTIPKCAVCDLARTYLNSRKIPYTEKNVSTDIPTQEELRKKSGSLSVPTIMIGPKIITEYSQAWIESELDQAGYPNPKKATSETEGAPAPEPGT